MSFYHPHGDYVINGCEQGTYIPIAFVIDTRKSMYLKNANGITGMDYMKRFMVRAMKYASSLEESKGVSFDFAVFDILGRMLIDWQEAAPYRSYFSKLPIYKLFTADLSMILNRIAGKLDRRKAYIYEYYGRKFNIPLCILISNFYDFNFELKLSKESKVYYEKNQYYAEKIAVEFLSTSALADKNTMSLEFIEQGFEFCAVCELNENFLSSENNIIKLMHTEINPMYEEAFESSRYMEPGSIIIPPGLDVLEPKKDRLKDRFQ